MVNNEALSAAITDLRNQKTPNYGATAKKHNINKTTLHWQFKNKQTPSNIKQLAAQRHFSTIMEKILMDHINTLSTRGMLPTPQFMHNLVLKFFKEHVKKH